MNGNEEQCICPESTHFPENNTCINKCSAGKIPPGMCPDKCKVDKIFGFVCDCEGKYKTAKDKIHCENKLMCSEGMKNTECKAKNARCVEVPSSPEGYRCDCLDGYELFENKCTHKCDIKIYKDACTEKSALCVLNATYDAICKCPPLLDTDKTSGNCVMKAKYSYIGHFNVPSITYSGSPVAYSRRYKRATGTVDYFKLNKDLDNSLSFVYKDNYKEFLILNCKNENSDFKCEIEMKFDKDPQADRSLNVIATESSCVSIGNTEYCAVYPNLIMKKPKKEIFQETDPCKKNVKNALCGVMTVCKSNGNAYNCECKDGYATVGHYFPYKDDKSCDIHYCEDVNECLVSTKCAANSSCFNTPGSYKCFCIPGYINTTEDTKNPKCIGVCDHGDCNFGTCKPQGINGFSCNCDDYHTGQFCNETNSALKDTKHSGVVQTAIVGSVLGAILIAVLIGGYIFYRKNKRDHNDDDEYVRHRERAIKEERSRQGLRQQQDGSERHYNQQSLERRGSGDYRQYGESHMIPRVKTGGSSARIPPEMREDRTINAGDIRLSSVPRNGGHSTDNERRPQRGYDGEANAHPSLSRSTDQLNRNDRARSVVQYKNRGYEEE